VRLEIPDCIGIHPWYAHHISLSNPPAKKLDHYTSLFPSEENAEQPHEELLEIIDFLPEPKPLEEVIKTMRQNLESHPEAMVKLHAPY
jgi:hypothetical protein